MKECRVRDWNKHARTIDVSKLRVHNALTDMVLSTVHSGSVLEIGAQSGIDAEFLASRGLDVTTIDYSEVAIKLLKDRERIKAIQGNALSMPFADDSFDLVYSQGLLEHYREPELTSLINEQKRVVKNEGWVVIDVPNANSLPTVAYKQARMAFNRWIVPWETQFTPQGLRKLGEKHNLNFQSLYSSGYLPFVGRRLDLMMDLCFGKVYRAFEKRFGEYYQPCIGILFKNLK